MDEEAHEHDSDSAQHISGPTESGRMFRLAGSAGAHSLRAPLAGGTTPPMWVLVHSRVVKLIGNCYPPSMAACLAPDELTARVAAQSQDADHVARSRQPH